MKAIGERILLDSSAWLSYFLAESHLSKGLIEEGGHLLMTSVLSIFEIKRKMLVMKNIKESKIEEFLKFIKNKSLLIEVNEEVCQNAAKISLKYNLHTIDSLIYCSAVLNNATLVSGDKHFESLENVFILSSILK